MSRLLCLHLSKSRFMKKIILLIFLLCALSLEAQKTFELGIGLGAAYYMGELDPFPKAIGLIRPAANGLVRYHLNNYLSLRVDGTLGLLAGNEGSYPDVLNSVRGISFYTPFLEGSGRVEIFPFGRNQVLHIDSGSVLQFDRNRRMVVRANGDTLVLQPKARKITPYIMLGAGLSYAYPYVDYNLNNGENPQINSNAINLDRKNRTFFMVNLPIGGGLRIRLGEKMSLGLEAALRVNFSDYLDGMKAVTGSKADDWYVAGMVTISRSFGKTDRDGDGVADRDDKCPNLPGRKQTAGCPDADLDGIVDAADACPNVAGPAVLKGCPGSDRDLDGIADEADLCPDMAGDATNQGCPDSDNDGISDNNDLCPGIKGEAKLKGCPDSDGDGVPDRDDLCPTVTGTAGNSGCPGAVALYQAGLPFKALYFNSQKQDWFETSYTTLKEVLQILNENPGFKVKIEGHTDNSGELPANQLLSEQRAKKCFDYLVSKGIDPIRMSISGFGASRPALMSNPDTPQARQLSRRVEIHFFK